MFVLILVTASAGVLLEHAPACPEQYGVQVMQSFSITSASVIFVAFWHLDLGIGTVTWSDFGVVGVISHIVQQLLVTLFLLVMTSKNNVMNITYINMII